MFMQVIYGAAITDPTSATISTALTEHWIHIGGPKKQGSRYHVPSLFFTPGTRLSSLVLAIENASPPLVLTAELCGLHHSPIVSQSCLKSNNSVRGDGWRVGLSPHVPFFTYPEVLYIMLI